MKSRLLSVGDFKTFGLWLSVTEMECFARGERKGEGERGGRGEEEEGGRERGRMMFIMTKSLDLFGGVIFFCNTKSRWQSTFCNKESRAAKGREEEDGGVGGEGREGQRWGKDGGRKGDW